MKICCSALCSVFFALVAIGAAAQDTSCENFETDTIACNDYPYSGCSSRLRDNPGGE